MVLLNDYIWKKTIENAQQPLPYNLETQTYRMYEMIKYISVKLKQTCRIVLDGLGGLAHTTSRK
jgi:hypothetical protein